MTTKLVCAGPLVRQWEHWQGSRVVMTWKDAGSPYYTSRLYTNWGETVCNTHARAKTWPGVLRQASRMLSI